MEEIRDNLFTKAVDCIAGLLGMEKYTGKADKNMKVYAILGPTGTGKSTVARILLGLPSLGEGEPAVLSQSCIFY